MVMQSSLLYKEFSFLIRINKSSFRVSSLSKKTNLDKKMDKYFKLEGDDASFDSSDSGSDDSSGGDIGDLGDSMESDEAGGMDFGDNESTDNNEEKDESSKNNEEPTDGQSDTKPNDYNTSGEDPFSSDEK